jgi:hypothetical protein
MKAIEVKNQKDKFLITLDKSYFDKESLYGILEKLRIEYLANKVNFDASIEKLGEEIKEDWWKKNKKKYIKRAK